MHSLIRSRRGGGGSPSIPLGHCRDRGLPRVPDRAGAIVAPLLSSASRSARETTPNMSRAGVLFSSDEAANVAFLRAAEAVAPSLGVKLSAIDVRHEVVERAVATLASEPAGGLLILPNPYNATNRGSIIVLAARHRLPAVYPFRYFAAARWIGCIGFFMTRLGSIPRRLCLDVHAGNKNGGGKRHLVSLLRSHRAANWRRRGPFKR
jgi:hypothetical protein